MLAALFAGFLIIPVLATYRTADEQAVTFAQLIGNDLSRFAPCLDVDRIVDPVAVLILALLDAACKVADHVPAIEGTKLRVADDADDSRCVKAHGLIGVI